MLNLFNRIELALDQNPHGWCDNTKAQALACMVVALRPEVSVEIGVFGGRSAIPIALAHKEIAHGILYAIDPWSAQASCEGYENVDQEWWSKIDHEAIYNFFNGQINLLGLQNNVRVVRLKSDAVIPPTNIGLLHVDGQHTDQAVRDVERFAANVINGGLVVMDDLNWTGGGVMRAVAKLKEFGFRQMYDLGTGAVFQRR